MTKWFERQRMNWLANRLAPFQRNDLASAFDISLQQATKDIRKFEDNNPGFWIYNIRTKHYERNAETALQLEAVANSCNGEE